MEKRRIQLIGYICLIITSILSITSITIAAVHFQFINLTWTNHGWGSLGATEIACMLLVWIMIGLGVLGFFLMSKIFLMIFSITDIISILFTFAIVIFSFLGSKTRDWDERYGCNAKYQGIWQAWQSIDIYLQAVDSLLCSPRCPCYLNATALTLYSNNSLTIPYYSQWTTGDRQFNRSTKFQECPKDVVADAYNKYLKRNAYDESSFRPALFIDYFTEIEKSFKCTGFCGTTYYDEKKRTSMKMVKYLFTDITRGLPEHIGCLPVLIRWLHKTLNAFAAVGCFLICAQIVLLLSSLYLLLLILDTNGNEENITEGDKKIKEIPKTNKEEKEEIKIRDEKRVNKKDDSDSQHEGRVTKEDVNADPKLNEEEIKQLINIPLESSFIPSDAMKEENEMRFNPSVLQQ